MSNNIFNNQFNALGTHIKLTVYNPKATFIFKLTQHLIEYYENLFSIFKPDSEISLINQQAGINPVAVSPAVQQLVTVAKNESLAKYGFNCAIGPLVKAWNIGTDFATKPAIAKINELLTLTDPSKIKIENASIFLEQKGMQLDLGGIAKGFIADRIKDLWAAYGIKNGIVDLGGNLLLIGKSPLHADHRWHVGVQSPWKKRGKALNSFSVPQCSVVTSGIYERYLKINNQYFHHIIDPRTGYPFKTNLLSVTVFTTDSLTGEIESTKRFFSQSTKLTSKILGIVYVYQDHSIKTIGFN